MVIVHGVADVKKNMYSEMLGEVLEDEFRSKSCFKDTNPICGSTTYINLLRCLSNRDIRSIAREILKERGVKLS